MPPKVKKIKKVVKKKVKKEVHKDFNKFVYEANRVVYVSGKFKAIKNALVKEMKKESGLSKNKDLDVEFFDDVQKKMDEMRKELLREAGVGNKFVDKEWKHEVDKIDRQVKEVVRDKITEKRCEKIQILFSVLIAILTLLQIALKSPVFKVVASALVGIRGARVATRRGAVATASTEGASAGVSTANVVRKSSTQAGGTFASLFVLQKSMPTIISRTKVMKNIANNICGFIN